MTRPDLNVYQQQIGITFANSDLLQRALTHRSYLNEHPGEPVQDNERLEFLGDAVLDFIAAGWLYERFPDLDEGDLTRLRAGLVRTQSLASYASLLGIGDVLLMGRGEEENGGRKRLSNLCGAFEAFAGALYLDQGLAVVAAFAQPYFEPILDEMLRTRSYIDAKSRLQEWSQATLNLTPIYHEIGVSGPDHAREFTIEVRIGEAVYGVGTGHSKQIAAQAAAQDGLKKAREQGYAE
ncbi:MAG TPA: ribonuclease III [Aggregatilineales bacterium]|nr:ribonuclease III [Aggregatilineales bacterium]